MQHIKTQFIDARVLTSTLFLGFSDFSKETLIVSTRFFEKLQFYRIKMTFSHASDRTINLYDRAKKKSYFI